MNIEIDQSGKIENTNKNTIIAFSNNCFESILIVAKDKRKIQKIFRQSGKPRIFVYKLFAILIFLLVKNHLKKISQIVIDEEYTGKSDLIKSYLMREIIKINSEFSRKNIIFKQISRKSRAHYVAYGAAIGKRAPDKKAELKEVLKFLIK